MTLAHKLAALTRYRRDKIAARADELSMEVADIEDALRREIDAEIMRVFGEETLSCVPSRETAE